MQISKKYFFTLKLISMKYSEKTIIQFGWKILVPASSLNVMFRFLRQKIGASSGIKEACAGHQRS